MQSDVRCDWPGCTDVATTTVHGRTVCCLHMVDALREIVKKGSNGPLDNEGRPSDGRWLNCIGRLIAATAIERGEGGGLTPAKISDRGYDFQISPPYVRFAIERHPAGFVNEQHWAFNLDTDEFCCESEKTLRSDLPYDKDERPCCPGCGTAEILITPGRVKCWECSFELLHDHSW